MILLGISHFTSNNSVNKSVLHYCYFGDTINPKYGDGVRPCLSGTLSSAIDVSTLIIGGDYIVQSRTYTRDNGKCSTYIDKLALCSD